MKDGAVKSGVTYITRTNGMTHSVQVFSPELIIGTIAKPSEGLSNGKVALSSNHEPNHANKGIPFYEVDEFPKVIKRSEYKVVD